jgi:chromosome segregation ATPase
MMMKIKRSLPMKTYTKLTLLAVILFTQGAWAKTEISEALQQIKTNEDNAKGNKKQYQENESIASKNIVEVTAAIKALREQKSQLITNTQNLDRNRAILEKMQQKLQEYTQGETQALKKEDAQIAQLKTTLSKLETNKKQHEENLATYQQKINDVNTEKADWDSQKQATVQIAKDLDSKEAKALSEREKWIAKRKGYHDEAVKWDKESEIAEQHRVKFDKLKD